MFRAYARDLTYSDRVHGFYFDKNNGAIICTSFGRENVFFKQLQNNVSTALKPLIELVAKVSQEELNKYAETGRMFSAMPDNHPASILLNLRCVLEARAKFFGAYKQPLANNAIPDNSSFNSINVWSKALAELTHVDYKEAYKLLLKLNACKEQYYCVDSTGLPVNDRFSFRSKESESYYKEGIQEIISFAEFQKKIEKSIGYIFYKANSVELHENQYLSK